MRKSAIVIGAGIVGLAAARALSLKDYSVTIIERNGKATGASIRNFGMVWPIGQPIGPLYQRAMRSREIWKEIGSTGAFWFQEAGSFHLAYHDDEWQVLQELYDSFVHERDVKIFDAVSQVKQLSCAVKADNFRGALYSSSELIVDPREAIEKLPAYLSEQFDIKFIWNTAVNRVEENAVFAGGKKFSADIVFVCSGQDIETLYPETFSGLPVIKCKLQMMRLASQPEAWRIGPALCGGLSLIHYKSFEAAPSLGLLKKRYEQDHQEYVQNGIHVMASQNGKGEITIGDSHEYGNSPDPFDQSYINQLVLNYLQQFAQFRDWTIIESWNGVYLKMKNGNTELFNSPAPGVFILNGLGGAGMTLSFGLAEEAVNGI
jgi:FAD dependent oxidoreductase TIGR03364